MSRLSPARAKVYGYSALALAVIAPASFWRSSQENARLESVTNFALGFDTPVGWKPVSHGPMTLFLFEEPGSKLRIRGSINQIVADYNPTPDLDRDGLTQHFQDITTENLKWKATLLDVVPFEGGSYRLIRREAPDRIIVSAFAVRGNTTVLMALSGVGKAKSRVDGKIPYFREYLATTTFAKTHLD